MEFENSVSDVYVFYILYWRKEEENRRQDRDEAELEKGREKETGKRSRKKYIEGPRRQQKGNGRDAMRKGWRSIRVSMSVCVVDNIADRNESAPTGLPQVRRGYVYATRKETQTCCVG